MGSPLPVSVSIVTLRLNANQSRGSPRPRGLYFPTLTFSPITACCHAALRRLPVLYSATTFFALVNMLRSRPRVQMFTQSPEHSGLQKKVASPTLCAVPGSQDYERSRGLTEARHWCGQTRETARSLSRLAATGLTAPCDRVLIWIEYQI